MTLYPYQQKAVNFIGERKRVYLAMEMGLGKTLTALAAAHKFGSKNILVVAEKNEIVNSENFRREIETNFPDLKYYSLREVDLLYATAGSSVRTVCGINPDGLVKHDTNKILDLFDAMIVDEATLAKTTTTARFKRVRAVADGMTHLSLLSGTPMMNGAAEIYAPLLLVNHPLVAGKGAKGKRAFEAVFAGGHFRKIRNTGIWFKDYVWWCKGANNVRELRYLVQDQFFFMRKDETGVFKKKERTIRSVPMTLHWLAEYNRAWEEYYEKAKTRDVDLDNVNELRNLIENGQMYQVNSRWKAAQVAKDIFDGRYGNARIVVFSMFVETDVLLQKYLSTYGVSFKPFEEIAEWKKGTEQVLVGRIKAHGKGANLPEASVVLFVDMDFVPANNLQAECRIDRPEQTRDMLVSYYITEGEDIIDAHIRKINRDKSQRIEKFMTPLTAEEVEDMPRRLAAMRVKHGKDMEILGI